jgi:hypothetical protein
MDKTWRALWLTAAGMTLMGATVGLAAPAALAAETAKAAYESGRIATNKDVRERSFARGMELAKARLVSNPDDPEGLYWLAVNMGAHALERGKMSALPVVPRMEAILLRLDQVDPRYESAGAARVLGRLYHQAPAVISVGSNKKAAQFLAKAVSLAPAHPGNLAFAADFQAAHGSKAVARDYAARCLAALSGRQLDSEEKEWAALARETMEATR